MYIAMAYQVSQCEPGLQRLMRR